MTAMVSVATATDRLTSGTGGKICLLYHLFCPRYNDVCCVYGAVLCAEMRAVLFAVLCCDVLCCAVMCDVTVYNILCGSVCPLYFVVFIGQ